MKKKIVLLLCVATMACMSFTACGGESNEPATEEVGEEKEMGDPEKEVEDVNEEDLTEESETGEVVENIAPEDAAQEAQEEIEEVQEEVESSQEDAEENAEVAE